MRPIALLLIALVAVGVSVALYLVTGGHLLFFALPLLFGLPLLAWRRRR
jgi:preprotein translocase subunit SecF